MCRVGTRCAFHSCKLQDAKLDVITPSLIKEQRPSGIHSSSTFSHPRPQEERQREGSKQVVDSWSENTLTSTLHSISRKEVRQGSHAKNVPHRVSDARGNELSSKGRSFIRGGRREHRGSNIWLATSHFYSGAMEFQT